MLTPEFEIQLRDVILFARHGVLPDERVTGNQYVVNVRLRIDASGFDTDKDDLGATISYAEVYDILKLVMSQPVALLETVVVKFSKIVLKKWPNIRGGEIELIKSVPPINGMVGKAGVKYCF